jgi:hypothetical protein
MFFFAVVNLNFANIPSGFLNYSLASIHYFFGSSAMISSFYSSILSSSLSTPSVKEKFSGKTLSEKLNFY